MSSDDGTKIREKQPNLRSDTAEKTHVPSRYDDSRLDTTTPCTARPRAPTTPRAIPTARIRVYRPGWMTPGTSATPRRAVGRVRATRMQRGAMACAKCHRPRQAALQRAGARRVAAKNQTKKIRNGSLSGKRTRWRSRR